MQLRDEHRPDWILDRLIDGANKYLVRVRALSAGAYLGYCPGVAWDEAICSVQDELTRAAPIYIPAVRPSTEMTEAELGDLFDRAAIALDRIAAAEGEAWADDRPRRAKLFVGRYGFFNHQLQTDLIPAVRRVRNRFWDLSERAVGGTPSPSITGTPSAPGRRRTGPASAIARAIGVVIDHPDWTDKEVAAAAECHPGTLAKSERYKAVREAIRRAGAADVPRVCGPGRAGSRGADD